MSETNDSNIEQDQIVENTNHSNDNDETWSYENSQSENTDKSLQEFDNNNNNNNKEKPNQALTIGFADESDDDDDNIQVTIGNYQPDTPTFIPKPQKLVPFKPPSIDPSTFEHDVTTAYKDDEKPWKKPGADITDYFNYGFSEETWTQYCDRQRRLRAENNLARMNMNHMPPMGPMNSMLYPMNIRPMTMINRPMNMQMLLRPINTQLTNGKIGVIGSIDRTSRRPMYETPGSFEYQPFPNPTDGQPTPSNSNQTPSVNNTHQVPTLGAPRLPIMNLPRGMPYRPQFFPQGPILPGVNLPQSYFIPPPEPSTVNENLRRTSSRSPTPEQDRSNDNDKLSKDSRSRHHHRSSPSKHRSHEYERPRDDHSRKRHHYDDDRSHRSKRSRRESDNDDGNDDDAGNHHRRSRYRSSDNKNRNIE